MFLELAYLKKCLYLKYDWGFSLASIVLALHLPIFFSIKACRIFWHSFFFFTLLLVPWIRSVFLPCFWTFHGLFQTENSYSLVFRNNPKTFLMTSCSFFFFLKEFLDLFSNYLLFIFILFKNPLTFCLLYGRFSLNFLLRLPFLTLYFLIFMAYFVL